MQRDNYQGVHNAINKSLLTEVHMGPSYEVHFAINSYVKGQEVSIRS